MAFLPKPYSSTRISLSSLDLEKHIQIQKNLSLPPPKIWSSTTQEEHNYTDIDSLGFHVIRLNHPLIRLLYSCNSTDIVRFDRVFARIHVSGFLNDSLFTGKAIKKLSSSPASLNLALRFFESLQYPDAFICNTIITAYLRYGNTAGALRFYVEKMAGNGILPSHFTFPLLGKICGKLRSEIIGPATHSSIVKLGFEFDLFVRNSTIRMYSAIGRIDDARLLFDSYSETDLVTLNSMIDGYSKNGDLGQARKLFDEMQERDEFTWNSMISGYTGVGDMISAEKLFDEMPLKEVVSYNCMIEGYSKLGNVAEARRVFDSMNMRNVVSWNTILALYSRKGIYEECLCLFEMMIDETKRRRREAVPNEATLVSVLIACAKLGRLDKGKWVHSYITSKMDIKGDVLLSTALLTMYSKCGDMDQARAVFDEMPEKNVVSWNAMIAGYGMDGKVGLALEFFLGMEKTGEVPNENTFVSILSACGHCGAVLEGWWCFDRMIRVCGIEPRPEHYNCMADLLSRAGMMDASEELIEMAPEDATTYSRGALLSACLAHSKLDMGELVARRLIQSDPSDIGAYILLSNLYATAGRWDCAEKVRIMMKEQGLQKDVGLSSVRSVVSGCWFSDFPHRRAVVYSMLGEMGAEMKLSGTL